MKINDLIFKELLLRNYTLEGKTRVWNIADSKLWYITPDQAQGYLDLEKDEGYKQSIINKEVALLKKHLPNFIKDLPNQSYNLVDLGCGDGKKASLFIKEFREHFQFRYCPIDISAYMVNEATETIRNVNESEIICMTWNISDFENLENVMPLFRSNKFTNHFMMLLGNTLGNFDRDDILHGIASSMNDSDVLLIGNGISNGSDSEEWIKNYRNQKIKSWLINVALLLGLQTTDVQYEVRFVNSRIEEMFILTRNVTISHLGRTIAFYEGDVIVVAVSYKYDKNALQQNVSKFFNTVQMYTDPEETYALMLCKK